MLAGPIVRRVEPRLVAIWVALSRPQAVRLVLYDGRQQAPVPVPTEPLAAGAANTLRVGNSLHLAVAVVEIKTPAIPLGPGRNYAYNLHFHAYVDASPAAAVLDPAGLTDPSTDLLALGLLKDGLIEGFPHLALGYQPSELPSFALPPASLTDLRILHGSCRRPGFKYGNEPDAKASYDALTFVDDLILTWRGEPGFDANHRPHQLFLTGDQIYADDVEGPMLPMLNRAGNRLLGKVEDLPTVYPPKADPASKQAYLGVPTPAGSASLEAFIAKHPLDALDALKDDRGVRAVGDPTLERKFTLLYDRPYAVDASVPASSPRLWPADLLHFPANRRKTVLECETKFSTTDIANHLISFGEYCAMYLAVFCNAIWEPAMANLDELYALPDKLPQLWDLHACFGAGVIPRTARPALLQALKDERCRAEKSGDHDRSVETLGAFIMGLPKVRRALANVATYMVFDDHDVTDDWNIGRAWRDQVQTTLLGRRIITNALVAYALFQDWGNDPLRYRKDPFDALLRHAGLLFPATGDTMPAGSVAALQTLFGLNQPDPETPPPGLLWHWTVDGPRHRVIALDTRTRRSFRSRYLPPGLLSPKALEDQLPDPATAPLPAGMDVLVVISQTPVAMPAVASAVIVPLMGAVAEFKARTRWRNLTGLEPDSEMWPGDELAFEAVLRRLAAYRRVVVLSGEVHWGSTAQLTYWTRGPRRLDLDPARRADLDNQVVTPALRQAFAAVGITLSDRACAEVRPSQEWLVIDPPPARRLFLVRAEPDGLHVYEENEPARMAQFTSSGLKNIKKEIAVAGRTVGAAFSLIDAVPAERLVWFDNTPAPLQPPAGGRFGPAVRDRLGREPVTVPSAHWPAGTTMAVPDACWRIDMVRDGRPDPEREEFVRPVALPAFDLTKLADSSARIASAHAAQLRSGKLRFSRGALYQSNLGFVHFEHEGTDLVACHDLYSHPPRENRAGLAAAHRVNLQRFDERRPALRTEA
jgi:hypothetical protein